MTNKVLEYGDRKVRECAVVLCSFPAERTCSRATSNIHVGAMHAHQHIRGNGLVTSDFVVIQAAFIDC